MLTPTNVASSGWILDETRGWRHATPLTTPAPEEHDNSLDTVRGVILGSVISSGMWVGLFIAGRALLRLVSGM